MKRQKDKSGTIHHNKKNIDRRTFLTTSALASAGLPLLWPGQHTFTHHPERSGKSMGAKLEKRMLGSLEVSAIGLGCMSMSSGSYNPPRSNKDMIPVIRGAVELGVNFFDTAEVYGPFTNEEIVGEALAPFRDQVVIATKLGFKFTNGQRAGRDARPDSIRKALEGMLRRLKTDRIDLLYLHRIDPNIPIEDVAGTFSDLIKEGKILHYGLSEVSPETLSRAHKVYPVTALQSEYSIIQRVPENQVLATCEELGIGFVPWGPVCRGFLADKFNEYSRFSKDSRFASVPYFTAEAIQRHMPLLNLVREWARRKEATPAQISLAWMLAEKPFIVPIPGTTKYHHLKEDLGALEVTFTPEELNEFREAFSKVELVGVRPMESALKDM